VARVLIAGCGYVGTAAARVFVAQGFEVEGWTRSGALPEKTPGVSSRAIDLCDRKRVEAAEGDFDVVIHAASTRGGDVDDYRCLYFDGAQNLKERFPSSKLIFVSSTSVYSQTGGEWVDENSAANPAHERGRILRAAEDAVLESRGCVARFAGVYGPGRSVLLRRVQNNEAPKNPQPDRYVNQVHRNDAAFALVALAEKGTAGIWNVVDDQPLLLSECYRWLAGRLNRELCEEPVSDPPRKRGESNKRVRNEKLHRAGWNPAYPSFKEGAERTFFSSR